MIKGTLELKLELWNGTVGITTMAREFAGIVYNATLIIKRLALFCYRTTDSLSVQLPFRLALNKTEVNAGDQILINSTIGHEAGQVCEGSMYVNPYKGHIRNEIGVEDVITISVDEGSALYCLAVCTLRL